MNHQTWLFITFSTGEATNVRLTSSYRPRWENAYSYEEREATLRNTLVLFPKPTRFNRKALVEFIAEGETSGVALQIAVHETLYDNIQDFLETEFQLKVHPIHQYTLPHADQLRTNIAHAAEADSKELRREDINITGVYEIGPIGAEPGYPQEVKQATMAELSDELKIIRDVYWKDLSYKRLLFYVLLTQGATEAQLIQRVTTTRRAESIKVVIDILKDSNIIEEKSAGIIAVKAEFAALLGKLFEDEFGVPPGSPELRAQVESFFAPSSASTPDAFTTALQEIFNFITGREKPDELNLEEEGDFLGGFVFRNAGIALFSVKAGYGYGKFIASHAQNAANNEFAQSDGKHIALLAAPMIENELVTYARTNLKKLILLDVVSLFALRCSLKTLSEAERETLRRKTVDFFERHQQPGSVWNLQNGMEVIRGAS